MILRWLRSRATRQAFELRKQVWYILRSQSDLLPPRNTQEVEQGLEAFRKGLDEARDRKEVLAVSSRLEELAGKWLRPYPNASTRENIKEFLVSGVVILTLFTFFVQPMKIPSGSAQPSLYGNVVTLLPATGAEAAIPPLAARVRDWFRGIDYHHWTTRSGGRLAIHPVQTIAGFIKVQRFQVGTESYRFFWPPDYLVRDCGVRDTQEFAPGETVLNLKVSSGDRLFVDRLTYNFRHPKRGETIVFTSTGIPGLIQHTHYIKRLIAMGGERVAIGDDRHVRINGRRLDHTVRHFERVYAFDGPPRDSVFSGHVNDKLAMELLGRSIAPLFPNGDAEYAVPRRHYLAFGDNTMNSFDGRSWGPVPQEKVVGKALLVFWPFTSRFGLVWW